MQTISAFLDIAKFADFRWKNADVSRTQGMCHVIHIFFGFPLVERCNCAKFHHCRICVRDFLEVRPFCPPPHPWAASKKPILNRVNPPGTENTMIQETIFNPMRKMHHWDENGDCPISHKFLLCFIPW